MIASRDGKLSGQTVLVTGAGGFIGSHLTERLIQAGARTRAFVHYNSTSSWGWLDSSQYKSDLEVILGDVRDADSVSRACAEVDVVFHLAALIGIPYSYLAPLSYVRTNVEGTLNVLQAALRNKLEMVVHTSTSEVYGSARTVPISEDHPLQGQSARAIIPTIVTQAMSQPALQLGSLEPTRDLNYVADTVAGFVKAGETPAAAGQVINLGSGTEISVGDLARTIIGVMGKDLPVLTAPERVRPV